jgi:hypothetical protein
MPPARLGSLENQGLHISREELLEYANQVCDSIVHDQLRNPVAPMDGAFDATGRTASVATRMEGLLAALEFLPKDEFRAKVKAAAVRAIAFLLRAQIKSGPYAGGMPGAYLAGAPGTSEIRIDCVQHALSACSVGLAALLEALLVRLSHSSELRPFSLT